MNINEVQAALNGLGIEPKKSKGQNFMIENSAVAKIVKLANLREGEDVLEIGPGLGALTRGLLDRGNNVYAVELDKALYGYLKNELPDHNFEVVNSDFLKIEELPENIHACVSNLPYSQAVPILFHLFEKFPSIERALVLVQTEEAQRLTAQANSKLYSASTVKFAYLASCKIIGDISENAFYPKPNVGSSLLQISRNQISPDINIEDYFAFVTRCFANRRKTLFNNLKLLYPAIAASLPNKLTRAQELSPSEIQKLLVL